MAPRRSPFYDAYSGQLNLKEQRYLKRTISRLSKQIDRTLPVLDFGSGTGNVAKYLERAGLETVAMDISSEMLRENLAQHKIAAESQYLPFKDGCFGMITVCDVFHHLPNPIRALDEICRVAAPHCIILIAHEPVAGLKLSLFNRLSNRISWVLWRLTHPETLKRLLFYMFFHRKRLRELQARLKHIEEDLNLDSVQELCAVMEKHGFKVQTALFSKGVRVEACR